VAVERTMLRWTPLGYVGPALVWTVAFFILSLLVMVWMSLSVHSSSDGPSLANYT
jgi:uncharacterized membrane protein YhhN